MSHIDPCPMKIMKLIDGPMLDDAHIKKANGMVGVDTRSSVVRFVHRSQNGDLRVCHYSPDRRELILRFLGWE